MQHAMLFTRCGHILSEASAHKDEQYAGTYMYHVRAHLSCVCITTELLHGQLCAMQTCHMGTPYSLFI